MPLPPGHVPPEVAFSRVQRAYGRDAPASAALGAPASADKAPVIFSGEYIPAAEAVQFRLIDVEHAIIAGASETPAELSIEIPSSHRGVIRAIGMASDNPPQTRWRLRVNQAPAPGYDSLRGVIGAYERPADIWIRIRGAAVFDVEITNLSAAGITVSTHIWGWHWPERTEG
jgi:hypothetical protein